MLSVERSISQLGLGDPSLDAQGDNEKGDPSLVMAGVGS